MKTAAIDEVASAVIPLRSFQGDFAVSLEDRDDSMRRADIAARRANRRGVSIGHFLVVYDAGLGDAKRFDAGGVRLKFLQPLGSDHLETFELVGDPSTMQLVEPWQFLFRNRHDDLAADLVRDRMPVAKFEQRFASRNAAAGFD